jgi:hypothetical protein
VREAPVSLMPRARDCAFDQAEQNCTDSWAEWEYIPSMAKTIEMLTTEFDGDDGLIVTFSDGTTGAYVVEELLELRPIRERTKTETIEPLKKGQTGV